MPHLTEAMLVTLGKAGIKTLDDLADLATDELVQKKRPEQRRQREPSNRPEDKGGILAEYGLSDEQGNEIIMAARAHWFEDEPAAGRRTRLRTSPMTLPLSRQRPRAATGRRVEQQSSSPCAGDEPACARAHLHPHPATWHARRADPARARPRRAGRARRPRQGARAAAPGSASAAPSSTRRTPRASSRPRSQRAFKTNAIAVPADLGERIEAALRQAALDRLGLEARAGNLITGADRIENAARAGKVHLLLHAADAGEDGRRQARPGLAGRRQGGSPRG